MTIREIGTRDKIAMDRASVRSIDQDGHLHIAKSLISAAQVNEYLGSEIPNNEKLGLDPRKIYQLLRDPKEIEKGAATLHGKPLQILHKAQTAETHDKYIVVGSVFNPEWKAPNLYGEMTVWDLDAIQAINDETQKDLSAGYRYDADMTPGIYNGEKYDGVMRNLKFNHVILTKDGRVDGAVVGDQALKFPTIKELDMKTAGLSSKAVLAKGALAVYLAPKLAPNMALDFNAIVKGVTAKNFKAEKPKMVDRLKAAVTGKLAADADITDVLQMLDALEPMTAGVDEKDLMVAPEVEAEDEGPDLTAIKEYLKDKLSPEEHAKVCKMMDGEELTGDEEETEEEKKARLAKEAKDAPAKDMVTKTAMDAAITAAARKATADTMARLNAIREAEREVQPHIGALTGAMDSAEAIYSMALDSAKVDHKGITDITALRAMVKMLPLPNAAKPRLVLASDAAAAKSFNERFPEIAAVRHT